MTLSACFDPLGRYVCSLGCDGQANIYQLAENPTFIRRYKVSKDVPPKGVLILSPGWHPQGKWIALPG